MTAAEITAAVALQHARVLAQRFGLAILPLHRTLAPGVCSCRKGAACATAGKHPRIRWADRPAEAPSRAELEWWWSSWPDSRVGLLLGDRLCAFDVDEHGQEHGLDELHDLETTFGRLPDTWRALTPSSGLHVFFRLAGEVASTTHKLRDGVQLRAGRHVMACPPSDGREWEISPSEVPLADLPSWVPQLIREADPAGRRFLPLGERLRPNDRHLSYVAAARSMARIGLPESAISAALNEADRVLGDPPKDDAQELEQIAAWAIDAQAKVDASESA
jgi:hypothetical protein